MKGSRSEKEGLRPEGVGPRSGAGEEVGQDAANANAKGQGQSPKSEGQSLVAYSDEVAEEFFRRLACGRSISEVCRADDMPSRQSIYEWLSSVPGFRDRFDAAREMQADAIAEEILTIADTSDADNVCDEYGNIKPNHEWMNRSKLRVQARQWLLSKMLPRKYGDKVEQTVIGDPERPVHHTHHAGPTVDEIKAMSDRELLSYLKGQSNGAADA